LASNVGGFTVFVFTVSGFTVVALPLGVSVFWGSFDININNRHRGRLRGGWLHSIGGFTAVVFTTALFTAWVASQR